jgi:hypothetical protein
MPDLRPWKLVAPWWYWQRQIDAGVATTPRDTRPSFQKFNQSNFVDGFLDQPQHSLKFDPQVDQVYAVNFVPATITNGPFAGKSSSVYPVDANGDTTKPQKVTLVPQGIRKLFLDTHKRYYLVVCELHCDGPGFPTAPAAEACQVGFVVRRRLLKYPKAAQKEALDLLRQIVGIEAQIATLDQTSPVKPLAAKVRAQKIQQMQADGTFGPARAALSDQLAAKRDALLAWKDDNGVLSINEGWVSSGFDKIGAWQVVEEEPQEITEAYFPLYPLHANPEIPDHDASGRTIFFGVLPTSSMDTDAAGHARFDDKTTYEVRCFARRHDPACPRKTSKIPDCHGPLTWTLPSEIFRLAPQFDLDGTANRPVTINLPNLAELAAQVTSKPFGKLSPMKFVQPQSLNVSVSGSTFSGNGMGAGQVCFFAIPLITIVAFFVLQIFLPIVVLLFGLWFLLLLKFCIPPSVQIDAGLQAELSAVAPKADADLDAAFSVAVGPPISQTLSETQINADLQNGVGQAIQQTESLTVPPNSLSGLANSPLRALANGYVGKTSLPGDDDAAGLGLDLTGSLAYEVRVTIRPVLT